MQQIKYLLICLFIFSTYAAEPSCVIKGGGILDDILLQFGNAAVSWHNTIEPITKKFFFILFGMEFMWQLTVKKVFAGDIEKLWVFFFTRTVLCFFFAKYLINIEMYRGIIEFFSGLGSQIGGYSLNMAPGSGMNTLGPSAVLSSFSCLSDMIHIATDDTGVFSYITLKITLAIIQVIMFIVLIFIAYYLMQILLQAYLLVYAGFIFAGFAGSAWTRSYWESYISATISVGAKFLVVSLLLGVLNVQMQSWTHDINQAMNSNLSVLAAVIFRVCAVAVIISLALWRLPEWFASVVNGQISALDGNSSNNASKTEPREYSNQSNYAPEKGNFSHGDVPKQADIVRGKLDNFSSRNNDLPNPLR